MSSTRNYLISITAPKQTDKDQMEIELMAVAHIIYSFQQRYLTYWNSGNSKFKLAMN